ncbi:MAG: RluA family pseudouridine synthase [Saprospiraceae bacterium]|nr:RluA family pseudouridine synthase [Saprospiraceae bacterium]
MHPEILHEDNHLVIVNKPNGVLTHGDKTGDPTMEEFVKAYIKEKYNKPGNVFIKAAHRIDRPVSGVLVLGRTSKGHERMTRLFHDRQVRKTYWALTTRCPSPERGRVVQYLVKDYDRNVVDWHDDPVQGGKKAITDYEVHGFADPFYLIRLFPLSGRSHQLRVMLRSKRCPIAGDVKYGGRKISNPQALLLHAWTLSFEHPVKRELLTISAPVPDLAEWQLTTSVLPVPRD